MVLAGLHQKQNADLPSSASVSPGHLHLCWSTPNNIEAAVLTGSKQDYLARNCHYAPSANSHPPWGAISLSSPLFHPTPPDHRLTPPYVPPYRSSPPPHHCTAPPSPSCAASRACVVSRTSWRRSCAEYSDPPCPRCAAYRLVAADLIRCPIACIVP